MLLCVPRVGCTLFKKKNTTDIVIDIRKEFAHSIVKAMIEA